MSGLEVDGAVVLEASMMSDIFGFQGIPCDLDASHEGLVG